MTEHVFLEHCCVVQCLQSKANDIPISLSCALCLELIRRC